MACFIVPHVSSTVASVSSVNTEPQGCSDTARIRKGRASRL